MPRFPRTASRDFNQLRIRDGKTIHFWAVMPLYPGETALKLKRGAKALERRFERREIPPTVDPKRQDVSGDAWWKIWLH